MKCKVCGNESGKYPLCRACNSKKETGEIIKCDKCQKWHYKDKECVPEASENNESGYLYDPKKAFISKAEAEFFEVIVSTVPEGFRVFPQVNLATFIERTDNARFHNELFRNVDFLVTDSEFCPKSVIEINDQTHLTSERKERDQKVQKICEEAGIPIIKLWTSYGVNSEYIKKKLSETLEALPAERIHHFTELNKSDIAQDNSDDDFVYHGKTESSAQKSAKKNGCYIATCVYGSYECPQVWVLRRYRDITLAKTWYGHIFIRMYYAVSPILVKLLGNTSWFKTLCKRVLDPMVKRLQSQGVKDTPYKDIL